MALIIDRTTRGEIIEPQKVMDGEEILKWQQLVREVILAKHVQDYIVRLTLATHPEGPFALPITNQYLRWALAPAVLKPSRWQPKCGPCWKGATTSASRMCVGFISPRCGTA